jgi:drug/metabolite transporter (DMT)-like permease
MPTSLPPQLIALGAALSYAISGIAARRGMRYSTPITVTLVSVAVHALTLWAAVILTGVCTFPRSVIPACF